MAIHKLKTWPEQFEAIANNDKTAEFRKDDRTFSVGDTLFLLEFDYNNDEYTALSILREVSHIERGGRFGIPEGFVILSLKGDGGMRVYTPSAEDRALEPKRWVNV